MNVTEQVLLNLLGLIEFKHDDHSVAADAARLIIELEGELAVTKNTLALTKDGLEEALGWNWLEDDVPVHIEVKLRDLL